MAWNANRRSDVFFCVLSIHNSCKPFVIPMKARDHDTVSTAISPTRVLQDKDQLSQLFAAHYGRVLAAAYRITGNMADAEDAAQSLFLRIGREGIPEATNFGAYLYRAAVNGALDLLRKYKVSEPLETASGVQLGGPDASPEKAAWNTEVGRILRQAIGELPPRRAEMFALRYLEEMDNRQIAELMKTSESVVAVTLYQTRLRLREKLVDLRREMR
jgi:RNA polymerase sigma factor (sigma-70 family)